MRKVAFFDFDNTLYNGYTYQNFINFVSDEVINTDEFQNRIKDILDNTKEYNLIVSRMADVVGNMVNGWTKGDFEKHCKTSCHRNSIFDWAIPVIDFLKESGFETIIVSASFHEMILDSLNVLKIDKTYCSLLNLEEEKYNGKIKLLLNDIKKSEVIKKEMLDEDTFSIAFGDSMGDVPMLNTVNLAFLVRSYSVEVENIAKEKGWFVGSNHESIIKEIQSKI